jgi:carbonic anhydrase
MNDNAIQELFAHNRAWAADMVRQRPNFFSSLSAQQSPRYMWIGCSDSRVPANQITGLDPGEVFVHRNVANLVPHSDLNSLSAVQFAVERLKVKHLIVCGHYGCSGVGAALEGVRIGLADNWLRHVQDVRDKHRALLGAAPAAKRCDRLCELNVIEQVRHLCDSTVVQDAWSRNQELSVHGWVYGLHDGLIKDLNVSVKSAVLSESIYSSAINAIANE